MTTSERIRYMLRSGADTETIIKVVGCTRKRVNSIRNQYQKDWEIERLSRENAVLSRQVKELKDRLDRYIRPRRKRKIITGPAHWYG